MNTGWKNNNKFEIIRIKNWVSSELAHAQRLYSHPTHIVVNCDQWTQATWTRARAELTHCSLNTRFDNLRRVFRKHETFQRALAQSEHTRIHFFVWLWICLSAIWKIFYAIFNERVSIRKIWMYVWTIVFVLVNISRIYYDNHVRWVACFFIRFS